MKITGVDDYLITVEDGGEFFILHENQFKGLATEADRMTRIKDIIAKTKADKLKPSHKPSPELVNMKGKDIKP
jgi:hypothetical protein